MSSIHRLRLVAMAALILGANAALAGNVTIPNTFTAHSPAVATQVNANFGAVATAVNGSATDITALQAAIASLQATVTTLNNTVISQQTTINTLTSQMAAVQGSSVMALAANLDMVNVPDPNDANILYPTARFHGINVQVVNGLGDEGTKNGLGNLIVGYNPTSLTASVVCSDGQYTDQTSCETNGGIWAANHRSGSHNLIVGAYNAYSQFGGLLAGYTNVVNSIYSSVSGGQGNTVSGNFSSVSGGQGNTVSGHNSSVSGGTSNTASGGFSSVSGGIHNTASGGSSSVSGGYAHDATGDYDWRAGTLFEDL